MCVFAGILQGHRVTEVMVGMISCSVLHMENSIFKLWADWRLEMLSSDEM